MAQHIFIHKYIFEAFFIDWILIYQFNLKANGILIWTQINGIPVIDWIDGERRQRNKNKWIIDELFVL